MAFFEINDDREELFSCEWAGEELEEWLDLIRDSNLEKIKEGQELAAMGARGASVKCISRADSSDEIKLELEAEISNGDCIQLVWTMETDEDGDVADNRMFYNDEDDNEIPTKNFHWGKWRKAFAKPFKI